MPTYEYLCDDCGHNEEIVQKISADAIERCPDCDSKTLGKTTRINKTVVKKSCCFIRQDLNEEIKIIKIRKLYFIRL